MSQLEMEEDGIELYSPDGDEKGERIIEEADLSWGALRSMKKESFFYRKRKAIALWAFSIFMIGFVIALVSIAVVVIEEHDKVAVQWGYTDLKVEKFKSAAIIVPAGKSKKGFFYDIPKPPGDVMIRGLTLDIVDERGKTVPLEQLYNHHIFLGATSNTTFRIMGAVGAEGARIPIQLPKPYGVPVYGNEAWVVSFELINQWGLASGADLKVFITYEISYTPKVQPSNIVNWRLLGLNFEDRNKTFEWDVPGNGGLGSVIKLEQDYDWGPLSGTTVFSWGHVHIGAINNTLYDLSDPKKGWQVVCVSTPKYAPSGFMSSIDRKETIHTFPKDGKVRITSYYDNSKNYGKVMSLTATYASVLIDSEDPDEDIRRKLYEKKRMEELITTLGLFNSTITIPLPSSFFK